MRRNLHVRREERPAGVVKNSRCSLRRMRCAYYEDCAKAQNEELALLHWMGWVLPAAAPPVLKIKIRIAHSLLFSEGELFYQKKSRNK